MIKSISFNGISFNGNRKVQSKSKEDTKKANIESPKKQSINEQFNEIQALKEEINRTQQLIINASKNDPFADTRLLYSKLGELIGHQLEMEALIRQNISEKLEKCGL